jgi:hypothetical protein
VAALLGEDQLPPVVTQRDRQNLALIKNFFETNKTDANHGLSQSEIFDLTLFQRNWGTFGAGLTAQLQLSNTECGSTGCSIKTS